MILRCIKVLFFDLSVGPLFRENFGTELGRNARTGLGKFWVSYYFVNLQKWNITITRMKKKNIRRQYTHTQGVL